MKRKYSLPKVLNLLASGLGLLLTAASPAYANNAPGPLAFVSLLSLVCLIVVMTFAGGGYAVMKRLDDAKYPSKIKRTLMNTLEFIAGVVLFFAALFATIFGVAGFSLFAIGRGVKMIKWSKAAAQEERPTHLEGANPRRLRYAGGILIVLTLLVLGYSTANMDEVTGLGDSKRWHYTRVLQRDAQNAYNIAKAYLEANPKAGVVGCADLEKAGFTPSYDVTCFSDMTATSGSIRMTGPARWKLRKPFAAISCSGELTPAEP